MHVFSYSKYIMYYNKTDSVKYAHLEGSNA